MRSEAVRKAAVGIGGRYRVIRAEIGATRMGLRDITPTQAEHAAHIINNQRRRSLNYRAPTELYTALTAH